MTDLDLRITEAARTRISQYLGSKAPGSVLALMYGSSETYAPDGTLKKKVPDHWQFVAYPQAQAENLARDYAARGMPFFHVVDGITVCIPQTQFIEYLKGRTLDVEAGVVRIS